MYRFLKRLLFIIIDVVLLGASWTLAVFLSSSDFYATVIGEWYYLPIVTALSIVTNTLLKMYDKIWKYIGTGDMAKMMLCCLINVAAFGIVAIISPEYNLAWCTICSILSFLTFIGSRVFLKVLDTLEKSNKVVLESNVLPRVMVIGAGSAGYIIINELKTSDKMVGVPVCILDDDEKKLGMTIQGVKVVGKIEQAVTFAEKYKVERIIIAMPSAERSVIKRVIEVCKDAKCKISIFPGIYRIVKGSGFSVPAIEDVKVTDLLGREQVKVNLDEIMGYIEHKTVMVTGGGGSIGSELCRQIASHNPAELVIVDIYENNAYEIQQELVRKQPYCKVTVRIASVREKTKVDELFKEFKPQIVFHAAAHKHVPLMEDSPNEAVKNNVGGTYNVSDAAGRFGVEKFVLISTDKAVNPTNVMGATKRICEMIVQTMDKKYDTDYVAVRFGNVLGSNGSVIPLFTKQIESGGPVTVTHKDIVRYFMTIPEAVSLVLQAGAYAKGGEIFVLDMGEPVKIYDLAVNMIKLKGLEPNKDIAIEITGLRPGEKLYEERLMSEEGLQKTANEMISIGKPIEFDSEHLFEKIDVLCKDAYSETDDIKERVHKLVPTYIIDKR